MYYFLEKLEKLYIETEAVKMLMKEKIVIVKSSVMSQIKIRKPRSF